ncbi:hypothetical protein AWE51_15105 [Aquimarina aggregata]|uniref:DUF4280 domain-containing protein n=1 Tax=Aquimarina aggregata TaxID=1642818 RepID=A0A162Y3J7_9FLAO|nr:DUF6531 domain-containing protein [Aquimarina aggregata]KZS38907.1 hypothetical protein AWE51_15105 [Aquimarina aggregata]
MARKYVLNGEEVTCSYGVGISEIVVVKPLNVSVLDEQIATEKNCIVKRFESCTCPANYSKTCFPIVKKWEKDSLTDTVSSESGKFLITPSQAICEMYKGVIKVETTEDLDGTECKDPSANQENSKDKNTGAQKSSSSTNSNTPQGAGEKSNDPNEKSEEELRAEIRRKLESGEDMTEELTLLANKKTERDKKFEEDTLASAQKKIDEGEEVKLLSAEEQKRNFENNQKLIDKAKKDADDLETKVKNTDATPYLEELYSREEMKSFEEKFKENIKLFGEDLARHSNPVDIAKNTFHYFTGVGGQVWDDAKASFNTLFAMGMAADDVAVLLYERHPAYLAYLYNKKDKTDYINQIAKNKVVDEQISLAVGKWVEKQKNLPENIVNSVGKTHDEILAATTDQAMHKFGRSVVQVIGVGKKAKAIGQIFNKKFWTSLNLKTSAKNYVAGKVFGEMAAKYPIARDVMKITSKYANAKDKALASKKALRELKALGKRINNGTVAPMFNESQKTSTSTKKPQTDQQTDPNKKPTTPQKTTGTAQSTKQKTVGDPVDVVTGTVINDYIDFEIPGIIPLEWKRIWYSDSAYQGPLGYGCHHSYDIQLVQRPDDLLLTLQDGRPAFFPKLSKDSISTYNVTEQLTLTLIENNKYELFDHQKQLTFALENRSGVYRPTKLFNTDGITVQFQYINSTLHRIIDTAGRVIKLHTDQKDRIIKITLHHKSKDKTLVNYGYNEAGDMISMTDPLGQSTLAKFKNHLMVSKTDRNGYTYYWDYDKFQTGAKCIHTWGEGGMLEYIITYGKEYNTVTNALGHQSIYYYEGNLATKIIDPLGGEIINEYNEDQNLVNFTDEEGLQTQYEYDNRGNIIEIKSPDASSIGYVFDDKGRLQLKKLPEGGQLIKSYKNNRLDTIVSPDGMMTSFAYNDKGLISTVFDNQDNETHLFYDEDHNLMQIQLPNGAVSSWEYDEWGQCIAAINPEQHKQQFHYDILGRVTQVRLPDNNKIKLKYDGYEQIIEAIDNQRTVKFEYTPVGSLKTREENGRKVYFGYNKEDQLSSIINEKGESYQFTRNAKGDIIKEQGYDDITRHFLRDKAGKIIRVNRPNDKFSIYEYNNGGKISRLEHYDGSWATYGYNNDGLLVEAINHNSRIKIDRDDAGRIISEKQDDNSITSIYGELGLRTGIKSSLGANISFEHSAIGEGTKTVAKTGNSAPWEASYKYNSLGMETERILSGGVISSWSYDTAGRPLQQKVINHRGEQRNRSYQWDVNDKLKKIHNNLTGRTVRFTYDDFNNLASSQYEDGSYDYKLPDKVGNIYRSKDQQDREYGKNGKLLKTKTSTYTYDEEGNLIEKNTSKGTWRYQWDASGMLQSVLKPDKTKILFEYDALGRRTAKIEDVTLKSEHNRPSTITRFLWDGNIPLHEWKYDLKDRPKTIVDTSGKISKDGTEPVQGLITWVFDQGTFRPSAKITEEDTYSIITDHLGTPIEMYNCKGEKTWQAEYDMYGKVRKLAIGSLADCPFRFQGQYEDLETGLYNNRFRYYDPETGTYISQDPIRLGGSNPNFYAYTHDTNDFVDVFGLAEKKRTVLKENQKDSVKSESEVRDRLEKQYDDNHEILEKPRIYINGQYTDKGNQKYTVPDYMIINKKTSDIVDVVDAKNGFANFTTNQKLFYQYGGYFNGSSRSSTLPKGSGTTDLSPNSLRIVRTDVGSE